MACFIMKVTDILSLIHIFMNVLDQMYVALLPESISYEWGKQRNQRAIFYWVRFFTGHALTSSFKAGSKNIIPTGCAHVEKQVMKVIKKSLLTVTN